MIWNTWVLDFFSNLPQISRKTLASNVRWTTFRSNWQSSNNPHWTQRVSGIAKYQTQPCKIKLDYLKIKKITANFLTPHNFFRSQGKFWGALLISKCLSKVPFLCPKFQWSGPEWVLLVPGEFGVEVGHGGDLVGLGLISNLRWHKHAYRTPTSKYIDFKLKFTSIHWNDTLLIVFIFTLNWRKMG